MNRSRVIASILVVVIIAAAFFGSRLITRTPSSPKNAAFHTTPATPLSPAPTGGMSVEQRALFDKYHLDNIKLPPGFRISVFAEVPTARSLSVSPKGVVYVGNRENGSVYAVVDHDHDGHADGTYQVAQGLHVPNGVSFKDGDLYITTISSVYKVANVERDLSKPSTPELIYDKLPSDEMHGWKFTAFGPDGNLYIPVGIPCNNCVSGNELYGTIARLNLSTKKLDIVAKGIRNTVGFDWKPDTGELWFTDNGRDQMGDDVPKDELNKVSKTGEDFGAPYCWEDAIQDTDVSPKKDCSLFTKPVVNLAPHAAALGMRFYTGSLFPAEYKNQIFFAEHGSWNRATPIGYRIMLVRLDGDRAVSYEPFAEGWLGANGEVTGRPVDVATWTDGSLLVSDDKAGAIYRISYSTR
ncbi:PQQ-dependent sugar dehydrogenase [Candidatus Microgenomates bacterium]|nr:PQQ-dependent sugar dehydrogenase [Candidatus Microgenomates bacterium]